MVDLKGAGFPVTLEADLRIDTPEISPVWEEVDVTGSFDGPSVDKLSEDERKKAEILVEMTKLVMTRMQRGIVTWLSLFQNLTERDINRVTEILRKLEMDKPKITVRFGQEAIDLAKEIGVDSIVESEKVIREGLVVMQLPKPLAKYWYRTDRGAKKVNWGRIYGQLYDEFWQGVKYAGEQGLYLKRVNKVGVHDPKKYYYVFVPSFEEPEEDEACSISNMSWNEYT